MATNFTDKSQRDILKQREIVQHSARNWDRVLLKQELRLLKMERLHLEKKADERSLTLWEQARLENVIDEFMILLRRFARGVKDQSGNLALLN